MSESKMVQIQVWCMHSQCEQERSLVIQKFHQHLVKSIVYFLHPTQQRK